MSNEHDLSPKVQVGEVKKIDELPKIERLKIQVEQGELTVSQILMEIANEADEFFLTEMEEVYASVRIKGVLEVIPINKNKFKNWLRKGYYEIFKKPPSKLAINEAVSMIEANVEMMSNNYQEVSLRVAEKNGDIFIDLGTPEREVVKVSTTGWEIMKSAEVPIKFMRPATMRTLPRPKGGRDINLLREYMNIRDKDWILLLSFLVGCFKPSGPYPILILQGPQGSAKSTQSKILKKLVDPTFPDIRSLPGNEEDLVISAQNTRLLAFDNLSGIGHMMSDALCKLATGGGFATRKLFENDEEVVFSATRPMVINGIDYIASRPDLADRAIILHLPPISGEKRISEEELWGEFNQVAPYIIGSLFDSISYILENIHKIKMVSSPRMADFAKWAIAAEQSFGFDEGDFLRAYNNNVSEAAQEAIEQNIIAMAIKECLDKRKIIEGNATTILGILKEYVPPEVIQQKQWIAPNQFKNLMLRLTPVLEANNIEYEYVRKNVGRIHVLRKIN